MLTLYMRYILLIPRLTKEHCNNPKNQTLTRFNPSIKRDGEGSRVLKQNSCKKFICFKVIIAEGTTDQGIDCFNQINN